MASHTVLSLLVVLPFLLTVAADDVVAPSPSPPGGELNLTGILENGGQYSTLLRLLQTTRIAQQLTEQLKNSYDGLTLFAPNDDAFTKLKTTGTLDGLTGQHKIQLLLYHVLPRYYSVTTFRTASNPLPTEGSGPGGMYTVNVTANATSHLVNMSTGVVDVPVSSTLMARFPLAVYSVNGVLLPPQLFRTSRKAAAPAAARKKGGVPKSDVVAEPSGAGEESPKVAAACRGMSVGWTLLLLLSWLLSIWSALEKCGLVSF